MHQTGDTRLPIFLQSFPGACWLSPPSKGGPTAPESSTGGVLHGGMDAGGLVTEGSSVPCGQPWQVSCTRPHLEPHFWLVMGPQLVLPHFAVTWQPQEFQMLAPLTAQPRPRSQWKGGLRVLRAKGNGARAPPPSGFDPVLDESSLGRFTSLLAWAARASLSTSTLRP